MVILFALFIFFNTICYSADMQEKMPTPDSSGRVRTLNGMGAMNTIMGKFEHEIIENFQKTDWVLDVGAAYGEMSKSLPKNKLSYSC